MKNIHIISLVSLVLLLSACGGGGGTSEGGVPVGEALVQVINCDNSNSTVGVNDAGDTTIPNYYTKLQDGDSLVKDEVTTVVEIIHDSKDNRKVCVQTGIAHIIR